MSHFQKNPRVRKIRVRNSGVGNGCANFMDTWKNCALSAGKTMSVKFPFFLGGGGVGGQTRVDLATLVFFPCFIGFFGPVNDVNLIKTL